MTVKERIKTIQDAIDQLQADISGFDQDFKYYKILIHDLCVSPMEIRLFRCQNDGSYVLVNSTFVNLLDCYSEENLKDDFFEAEFEYLIKKGSRKETVGELEKIEKLFGV